MSEDNKNGEDKQVSVNVVSLSGMESMSDLYQIRLYSSLSNETLWQRLESATFYSDGEVLGLFDDAVVFFREVCSILLMQRAMNG